MLASRVLSGAEILQLDVERQQDSYSLSLVATLNAPPEAVWKTLNHYACLHRLSQAVQSSDILQMDDQGHPLVQTQSRVCVWIFCKHLQHVQRMRIPAPLELQAESLDEFSDFQQGTASWRLSPHGEGTRMRFDSRMQPNFWVPPFIGPLMIQDGLRTTALETLSGLERLSAARHE